ncbi:MAG: glycoside hydrolase family 57 protein [Candidatus Sedimenticola endophacoides]
MSDERPKNRLKVVLCWHMHQPDYRGPDHSDFQLPWVYLHGIKDYVDMAAHLENNPGARAVVNFAPILLEQLEEYIEQIRRWLDNGTRIGDPLLSALAGPGLPLDAQTRGELTRACLKANEKQLVQRFRTYQRLVGIAGMVSAHQESAMYLNDQYLADLLVWYHLAWMGEHARCNDLRVRSLEKKRIGFTPEDRRALIAAILDLLSSIVPRYKRLAEQGRIELSVTPYAHPIIPLLLDIRSARDAMPDVQLPGVENYPGGEERAHWHIRRGREIFFKHFGFYPAGCWPSEGAVNTDTLKVLEAEGFQWAASGQQVLHNTLARYHEGALRPNWVHNHYRLQGREMSCFFRDDGLSDLIGFTYADWHADDAVANLVQHMENIAVATENQSDSIVSIIMDGENAWEHYPRNGCFFLDGLYKALADHPRLALTTFSNYLSKRRKKADELSGLVAGSWVYGTFSNWIGDRDKNRGWEMLVEAKQAYDRVMASGRLTPEQREAVTLQLATCEGSDWFWWFGDYNPGGTVRDFESLFRSRLSHLYELLGEAPPEYLQHVFATGSGDPARGGVMRQQNP